MLVLTRLVGTGVRGYVTADNLRKLLAQAEASEDKAITFEVKVIRGGSRPKLGFEFPEEVRLLRDELGRVA